VLPTPAQLATLASALQRARRPLVVAGEMRDGERLAHALTRLGLPVLAEPGSQLRRAETGAAVESYEALLRAGWSLEHGPDLVIRMGATPTSRALNAWLAAAAPPTFLIDPDHSWHDQDQVARHVVGCDPQALLEALPPVNRTQWRDEWLAAGKKAGAAISATLISTPLHEGHIVRALAARLPDSGQVFIGSSMPIRAADTFWPLAKPLQRFYGNRGASGIDGLVSTGLGVAPKHISQVMGVVKAYTTRVGGGAFPTELNDPTGEHLRKRGNEFGTVTGRPRRTGWLDLPVLRTSVMLNGVDGFALTKLDVLDEYDEIPVCTNYHVNGERWKTFPAFAVAHHDYKPEYKVMKGWKQSIVGITDFAKLPQTAKDYVRFIEDESGCKIDIISTGPRREETIIR